MIYLTGSTMSVIVGFLVLESCQMVCKIKLSNTRRAAELTLAAVMSWLFLVSVLYMWVKCQNDIMEFEGKEVAKVNYARSELKKFFSWKQVINNLCKN